MIAFLTVESRVSHPILPLRMFALRNVATANVVGVLWAAALFAWFFISALYLQRLLNYSAMQMGLAFLPANIIMAVFSLGLSAKLVMRFGIRVPLALGLLVAAIGLVLFARTAWQKTKRRPWPHLKQAGDVVCLISALKSQSDSSGPTTSTTVVPRPGKLSVDYRIAPRC